MGVAASLAAGIEKPTTEEVGNALRIAGEAPEDAAEVVGRRRDAHDFLGAGAAGVRIATSAGGTEGVADEVAEGAGELGVGTRVIEEPEADKVAATAG